MSEDRIRKYSAYLELHFTPHFLQQICYNALKLYHMWIPKRTKQKNASSKLILHLLALTSLKLFKVKFFLGKKSFKRCFELHTYQKTFHTFCASFSSLPTKFEDQMKKQMRYCIAESYQEGRREMHFNMQHMNSSQIE